MQIEIEEKLYTVLEEIRIKAYAGLGNLNTTTTFEQIIDLVEEAQEIL